RLDHAPDLVHRGTPLSELAAVHAGDRPDVGAVPAVHLLQRVADLTDRRLGPRRGDAVVQQVALARGRRVRQRLQRDPYRLGVAFGAEALQLGDLPGTHRRVVDLEDVDVLVLVQAVLVDPDHRLTAGV